MKLLEFLEQIVEAVDKNPDILDQDTYLKVGPTILEVNIKGENLTVQIDFESPLVQHAKRELEIIGEEPEVIQSYLKMITLFCEMGHSGGSASVFIPTLSRLLWYKNLAGLTDDPDEWQLISEDVAGRPDLWQNRRNSEAFSNDGGRSFTLLSERESSRALHISAKHDEPRPETEE